MHFRFEIVLIILNMPIGNGKVPKTKLEAQVLSQKQEMRGSEYQLGSLFSHPRYYLKS